MANFAKLKLASDEKISKEEKDWTFCLFDHAEIKSLTLEVISYAAE